MQGQETGLWSRFSVDGFGGRPAATMSKLLRRDRKDLVQHGWVEGTGGYLGRCPGHSHHGRASLQRPATHGSHLGRST